MAETQGKPEPIQEGHGDDGATKFVTIEQLNAAITSRFEAFAKKQEKSLEGFLAKLSAAKEEHKEEPKAAPSANPELAALQKELAELRKESAELRKANEAERAKSEAERQKARDITRRTRLQEALNASGVPSQLVRVASKYLDEAVLLDDENDNTIFKKDDGTEVDLKAGVRDWLKTIEGKHFLPARGTVGSGDRPKGGATPGTNGSMGMSREELANQLHAQLSEAVVSGGI